MAHIVPLDSFYVSTVPTAQNTASLLKVLQWGVLPMNEHGVPRQISPTLFQTHLHVLSINFRSKPNTTQEEQPTRSNPARLASQR